jgi:L-arabinose isomerase
MSQLNRLNQLEVWLVTGSISVYGEEALRQVDPHAREVAAYFDAHGEVPVGSRPRGS